MLERRLPDLQTAAIHLLPFRHPLLRRRPLRSRPHSRAAAIPCLLPQHVLEVVDAVVSATTPHETSLMGHLAGVLDGEDEAEPGSIADRLPDHAGQEVDRHLLRLLSVVLTTVLPRLILGRSVSATTSLTCRRRYQEDKRLQNWLTRARS